jgi:cysteine desulfurase
MSKNAKRELVRVLDLFGNPGALHQEALAAKQELEGARKKIAAAIGAHADEIIFTASGTEANNLALLGTLGPRLRQGEKLSALTTAVEHQSVLAPLQSLVREGLDVVALPVEKDGLLFPAKLIVAVRPDTALVSVQLTNSEMGALQPVKEIAKELRRVKDRKVLLHTDASQAPLWLDIKVEKLGVDLMTLDAQKVLGPKGIGCLYVKRGVLLDPIVWGGGQEKGKRAGTENAPLAASFAVALADAQSGVDKRVKKVSAVRDFLLDEIKKSLPDIVLHGPSCSEVGPRYRAANNLNISIPGLNGQMAVVAMDAAGIAVSTRSACSTDDEEPSYVIEALGVSKKVASEAIRMTLLPDASYSDARRIIAALAEVVSRYRRH